ncbi:MAG: hypothetical protein AABZ40_09135 [Thermodesulfobacteriota bacterium]
MPKKIFIDLSSTVEAQFKKFVARYHLCHLKFHHFFKADGGRSAFSALPEIQGLGHDGYVKSPDAALRFIPRHCGVRNSTPHSSGFARLACGLFTKPSHFHDF